MKISHVCAPYTKGKFNAMYRSMEYLLPPSLYRILCPFIAKRTKTLLTTFVVNVQRLFPSFSQPQHIDLERCAALSHTPALLQQLFMYRVASNATISSELPMHATSLTRGWIPELFKRRRPSANASKIFIAQSYNYEIFLSEIFLMKYFQLEYFPIYSRLFSLLSVHGYSVHGNEQ